MGILKKWLAKLNRPQCVYGPPPQRKDFDPKDNVPVDVYGPPEMFGDDEDDTEIDTASETENEDSFSAEENMPLLVYGPPEMLRDSKKMDIRPGTPVDPDKISKMPGTPVDPDKIQNV